jgi:hypothetical protein
MPFDWKDYLALAEFILLQAGSGCTAEAAYRGCVSKAYYAAFNHARRYATDFLAFTPRTRAEDRSQDHGRLRAHLIKRRRRALADALHALRDMRNECDYVDDLSSVNLAQMAADAVSACQYVISGLAPPPMP